MNCKKCGNVITNLDQFCPNCGEPNELYTGSVEATTTPVEEPSSIPMQTAANPLNQTPVEPVTPVTPVEPVAPVEPAISTPVEEPSSIPMQTATNPLNQAPVEPVTPVTPVVNEKPKKNVLFIIVVIVLSLVIIGLGVFITFKLLNNNSNVEEPEAEKVETKPTEVVTKNETMTYGGLSFTIPTGITKNSQNGVTFLTNKTEGYIFSLNGLTDEARLVDVKNSYSSVEATYKTKIESMGGIYTGASEYTLNGRTYFGISYYKDSLYSEVYFTEITDNYLIYGEIAYLASGKTSAYKALNEFLSSAETPKAGSFAKTSTKDQVLNGNVNVRSTIE